MIQQLDPTATVTNIKNGHYDDSIALLEKAVGDRRKKLANPFGTAEPQPNTSGQIKPGDTVKFSSRISPKYLIGRTATVIKVNPKSIIVACPTDPGYGRFSGSQRVRCPRALIEGA